MTRVKSVSVVEYTDGPLEGVSILRYGVRDREGSQIRMNHDADEDDDTPLMQEMPWERRLVYDLPEPMSKDEAEEWLNENQPEPVWPMLSTPSDVEEAEAENAGGEPA